MIYHIKPEEIEEMIDCIFDNFLTRTEAMEYAKKSAMECTWPDESHIDAIGQNGGDYSLVPHEFYD